MRQHVKRLKDKAEFLPAQTRRGIVVETRHGMAADDHIAAVRLIEPGDQIEQRRFADTGVAHDRDELAGLECEVEICEHDAACAVSLAKPAALERGNDTFVRKHHARSGEWVDAAASARRTRGLRCVDRRSIFGFCKVRRRIRSSCEACVR